MRMARQTSLTSPESYKLPPAIYNLSNEKKYGLTSPSVVASARCGETNRKFHVSPPIVNSPRLNPVRSHDHLPSVVSAIVSFCEMLTNRYRPPGKSVIVYRP
jgi:hypothetical protein